MNKQEVLEFLAANPVFHLATIEAERPRVRGMLLYRASDDGLVFHTGKMRELHAQLTANPNVEMSFNNGSHENLVQIRVSGTVELVEDLELKKAIVSERPFLNPLVERLGYDFLAVYRLKNGTASVWTMKENLAPKRLVSL